MSRSVGRVGRAAIWRGQPAGTGGDAAAFEVWVGQELSEGEEGSAVADTGEASTVSDRILLRGLRGRGRHGVFPAERDLGQVFIADVALQLDLRAAGRSDDLADTVDYGALAASVVARIEGEPVALLERLAQEIADICLAFPLVALVTVELHKPAAPISVPFDDVTVTITRGR